MGKEAGRYWKQEFAVKDLKEEANRSYKWTNSAAAEEASKDGFSTVALSHWTANNKQEWLSGQHVSVSGVRYSG